MALQNQLVCGLCDQKTQKELLCIRDLTIEVATEHAKAAEAVNRETRQLNPDPASTHQMSKHSKQKITCHRCGKQGHTGAKYIHKDKRYHYCNKVGHLSSVCTLKKKDARTGKEKSQHGKDHPTHTLDAAEMSNMPSTTMYIMLL